MSRLGKVPPVLAVVLAVSALCSAQVNTATIFGTVTDPSGKAVSQARILVRNEQTGGASNATANAAGEYTVTFLPPGRHTITIRAAGFEDQSSDTSLLLFLAK